MAAELLNREQKIMKLQHVIEEQRENEKIMYEELSCAIFLRFTQFSIDSLYCESIIFTITGSKV